MLRIHPLQRIEVSGEREILDLEISLVNKTVSLDWASVMAGCNIVYFQGSLLLTQQERAPMRGGNYTAAIPDSPISAPLQKTASIHRSVQSSFVDRSMLP
jgi:hypothetical protein